MKNKKFCCLILVLCISVLSRSQGNMMMLVEGQNQGKFKAESEYGSKYPDRIELAGFSFEVNSPRDVASGQATGKRQYQPITVWKKNGESSVQFLQALTTNETIKKVTIEYYKPDPVYKTTGLAYTVVLENARISGFKQNFGTTGDARFDLPVKALMYDEISFVFDKITVTESKSKTTATDSWRSTN